VNYTTTDHLGSPRVITDAIGQVTSRRDFLPFGEEITINVGSRSTALRYGSSDDTVRQKFTGYQKDTETSLDFAEARMYDNRFGRFTAVDPLLASGRSSVPQTFNRYIYSRNAPLVMIDPTGKNPADYYTRDGIYIGNDRNPDDKNVYFADVVSQTVEGGFTVSTINNVKVTTRAEIARLRGEASPDYVRDQTSATLGVTQDSFSTIWGRRHFYSNFGVNNSRGTRWATAAAAVAEDVEGLTAPGAISFGYSNSELARFANTGNRMIYQDVLAKLAALKNGPSLTAEQQFTLDAKMLAQEQTLIQPLYENLSPPDLRLLESAVKKELWLSSLMKTNSSAFKKDGSLLRVGDRWEFGMRAMGYDVNASQMPNPGVFYTSGEAYNRLNPTQPTGPIVARFRF